MKVDRFTKCILTVLALLMLVIAVKLYSPIGVAEAQTGAAPGVFRAVSSGDWRYVYVVDTRNGHLWMHNSQKPTLRWIDYGFPGTK
jgi:hypothetical protein